MLCPAGKMSRSAMTLCSEVLACSVKLRVGTVPPVGRGRKNILESEENRNAEFSRKVRTV